MNIVDVIWFNGTSCIGLVKVKDPYDGIKYYIGAASGMDEEVDKEHIAAWGAKFPKNIGDQMFGDIDE